MCSTRFRMERAVDVRSHSPGARQRMRASPGTTVPTFVGSPVLPMQGGARAGCQDFTCMQVCASSGVMFNCSGIHAVSGGVEEWRVENLGARDSVVVVHADIC